VNASLLKRAEALYFALEKLPPSARAAELARLCGSDVQLRREVESLLGHAEQVGAFLDQPALGSDLLSLAGADRSYLDPAGPDDLIGRRLGPWRIDRRIASGGMGTVYEAARADDAFNQRAAIKVVKRGMDTEEILARFRAERQTLAALNHPSIARLLDGGVTPDGRPYLVMEYVEGVPIDAYCDSNSLSTVERLRLFRGVCEGVRFAHAALVVHRDLKPGNILVTPDGVPKLLDFGIAKMLATGEGELTQIDDRRLTPEYASPEQVQGRHVTTSSDVYSLGVILYELLSGHRPYRFETRTFLEIERVVLGSTVAAPSVAVGRVETRMDLNGLPSRTLTPELVSKTREGTPDRLRRRLRGDLDTIILAALRKEPDRRYSSAEALLGDLDRYLAGLPVTAHKDTLGYRTRKFVGRHRTAVALGTLVILMIAGTAVATAVQARRIAHERDQARQARDDAYRARDEAESIVEFMREAIEAANPNYETESNQRIMPGTTYRAVVDAAAANVDAKFVNNPTTGAAVRAALGRTYLALGEFELAEELTSRAMRDRERLLMPGDHDIAESLMDMGALLHAMHRPQEAEPYLRRALDMHRALRGEENLDTARVYNDLGAVLRTANRDAEAADMHAKALAIRRALDGDDSIAVAESLNNLAAAYRGLGRLDEAQKSLDEVVRIRSELLRPDHPLVAQALQNLGVLAAERGDPHAEQILLRALDAARLAYPPGHPAIAYSLVSVGSLRYKEARYEDAEPMFRAAFDIRSGRLRPDDPVLASTQISLGRTLAALRKDDKACTTLRAGLERVRRPGEDLPIRLRPAVEELARLLKAQGKTDEADEWLDALPLK